MTEHINVMYFSINGDDTLELPIPLEVEGYFCGVIEMSGKINNSTKDDLYLCSDICEESSVGLIRMPVLRSIRRRPNGLILNDLNHIIWLKVMRPRINTIRLYISNAKGEIVAFADNNLKCTLLFKTVQ